MTIAAGYCIRPATPDDIPALAEIERQADSRFYDVLDETGLTRAALTSVTAIEPLQEGQRSGHLLVATSPVATVVGFALMREIGGFMHLDEIAVLPSHGRIGLGSALLDGACAQADRAGCPAVTLSTFRDVPWNAPFYARRGFRVVAPSALGNAYVELVAMEQQRGLRTDLRVLMVR